MTHRDVGAVRTDMRVDGVGGAHHKVTDDKGLCLDGGIGRVVMFTAGPDQETRNIREQWC